MEIRSVLPNPLVQSFIADAEFTTSEPVLRYARFQIPTAAPPTVKGSVAQVSWELTGRLEMATGSPHHPVPGNYRADASRGTSRT